MEAKPSFRILSLDGGGSKGFYTLGVLKELEENLDAPIYNHFDLIYGTSTGSIIGSLLALGKSVDEVLSLYKQHVVAIMRQTKPRHRSEALGKLAVDVFGRKEFSDCRTRLGVICTDWRQRALWSGVSSRRLIDHVRPRHNLLRLCIKIFTVIRGGCEIVFRQTSLGDLDNVVSKLVWVLRHNFFIAFIGAAYVIKAAGARSHSLLDYFDSTPFLNLGWLSAKMRSNASLAFCFLPIVQCPAQLTFDRIRTGNQRLQNT
ncbi:MAG: patatin-like phospholipase family protein [Yoonia sp.]|uniref:patatin-like phospholipase family protein n=1 Tax=Yoonia sp. TaxID=2212373 RepID=UPI003EF3E75C